MQKIDFTALPKTKKRLNIFPNAPKPVAYLLVLIFLIVFLSLAAAALLLIAFLAVALKWVAVIGFIVLFVWLIMSANSRNKKIKARFGQFLQSNGWQAGGANPEINFFKQNHFVYLSPGSVGYGTLDGLLFSISETMYADPQGQNTQNLPLVMLAVELPKEMPTILLFPRIVEVLMQLDSNRFGLHKVSLEGDFDKHMGLWIPVDSQVDALSYITPDVMQAIKQNHYGQVIIISGKYACVTNNDTQLTRDVVEPLFSTALTLIKELKEKQHIF